jgi:[CysO sulfur-carrier protein]-S-L-cysteine hydrolase
VNNEWVHFRGHGLSLLVSYETLEIWESFRQKKPEATEKFGVIIGSRSEGKDEYWVESVTTPFPKDKSTRFGFMLQDRDHQNAVDMAFKKSRGTSVYQGTWHTHPEHIPTPSAIDILDWLACTTRNSGKQLFFVIVGVKEVHVYVRKGVHFRKMMVEG